MASGIASQVKEHMEVLGSEGGHVGIVDAVEGDRIRLTRNDPDAEGKHHYLPLDIIKRVEGNTVRLTCTVDQAHDRWSEEAGPDGKAGAAPRGTEPGSSRAGP
ncbi:DUF2171 domain-containing protein [Microvirga massiliensis]|uniref:DUF2171 domain-containing protein n=1 Tax=Microvirga massiliensis TaxID=1033741 RepID=UPI0007C83F14|nr:DUF2171 domain-containing protein [Microvirga massiliensis]